MAKFILNQEAKQIFVDAYNNPEISSKDLHTVVTTQLQAGGHLDVSSKFNAMIVRNVLEVKLGMPYRNRPRKKKDLEFDIQFEDDTEDQDPSVNIGSFTPTPEIYEFPVENTVVEEVEENSWTSPKQF